MEKDYYSDKITFIMQYSSRYIVVTDKVSNLDTRNRSEISAHFRRKKNMKNDRKSPNFFQITGFYYSVAVLLTSGGYRGGLGEFKLPPKWLSALS